jgi:hypothetical protein
MGIHFTHVTDRFIKNDKTLFGLSMSKAGAGSEPAARQAHRER